MQTAPNLSEVEDTLLGAIYEAFPLAETTQLEIGQNMLETGVVDSMGLLTIIETVESKYEIVIDDEDVVMENFGSVASLAKFVLSKLD